MPARTTVDCGEHLEVNLVDTTHEVNSQTTSEISAAQSADQTFWKADLEQSARLFARTVVKPFTGEIDISCNLDSELSKVFRERIG